MNVSLVRQGTFAELVLQRESKLNALSVELLRDMLNALDEANRWVAERQITCLVLCSSSPKAFCVGADLKERLAMSEAQVIEVLQLLRSVMDKLSAFPLPTIAVIEGAAFGGGLELALACDLRVAAPSASMGLPETRLAIIPGAGGTQRLARLVGPAKALEWIASGRKYSASEALNVGVVNEVSEHAKQWALQFANDTALAGPLALEAAKSAVWRGLDHKLSDGLDVERSCYEIVLRSEDRLEGLRAFSEKRSPKYTGK